MRSVLMTMVLAVGLLACGGSDKPVNAPDGESEGAPSSDESPGDDAGSSDGGKTAPAAASEGGVPTECAKHVGDVCLPPKKFVAALCNHAYPSVAVAMFSSGTPWTRGYLTHETEAVNASGGGSSNEKMSVDEEVLVVRQRKSNLPKGMTVSGAEGGLDVLRWDGACVSLHPSEVRFEPPRKVKNARVIWTLLENHIRDQLKEDETVYKAYIEHKRTCKGVSFGKVSKECVKADRALSEVIAAFVRETGGLPSPKKMPEL